MHAIAGGSGRQRMSATRSAGLVTTLLLIRGVSLAAWPAGVQATSTPVS